MIMGLFNDEYVLRSKTAFSWSSQIVFSQSSQPEMQFSPQGQSLKHEFKRSTLINIILGRQLTLALVKTLFAVVLLSIALAYTFKIVITARYALNSEDLASLIALLE